MAKKNLTDGLFFGYVLREDGSVGVDVTKLGFVKKAFRNRRDSKRPQEGTVTEFFTVLRYVGHNKHGESQWLCRCRCGNETIVGANSLIATGRGRKTKSCGCLNTPEAKHKRQTKPGRRVSVGVYSAEYIAWCAMKARCIQQANYVLRGITVCDEWQKSFDCFLASVGKKPTSKHSLVRIDNDRGYEPGNVRWATRREQGRNKSDNAILTFKGETLCLQDWSERTRLHPNTIRRRLRLGWSLEKALTVRPRYILCYCGVEKTVDEWAAELGISRQTLRRRITLGWTTERALSTPNMKNGTRQSFADSR